MPEFRRGGDAIDKAMKSRGGDFKPFVPQHIWKDDQEEKFILIISPINDTYTVELHEWIEVGEGKKRNGDEYTQFEMFISRKDPGIGEPTDKIEELGRVPRRRTLGVAVELEPEYETVKGRQRPAGFSVKTEQFTRKTDDGEVEVEAPAIGMLIQAPKNFFGWLWSFDRTQAPVHETPFQVIRRGKDSDTTYDFMQFIDADIDFTNLFDNIDNISYLSDEAEGLYKEIEDAEDDWVAATVIGNAMLEKRINELIDEDRYHKFMDEIDELPPSRFGGKKESSSSSARSSRPARKSPRNSGSSRRTKKSESNDEGEDKDRLARFEALRESVSASD